MSVHFPTADKRAQLREEFGVNISNWTILEEGRGTITGKLPPLPEKPPTNAEGLTKTAARFKTRQNGQHNPPQHKRKSSLPRGQRKEAKNCSCSTCGEMGAVILFNNGQYCSMRHIPTLGAQAAPSDSRSGCSV